MTTPTQDQPTIGIAMSAPLVVPRIKSRLFGGKFLRFHDVVSIMGFMHQNGLVLAEAMPAQHLQLMYLFGDTIDEKGMAGFFQNLALQRLNLFRELTSGNPTSSIEFMLQTEYQKIDVRPNLMMMNKAGDLVRNKQFIKASEGKIPLESIGDIFTLTLGEGIAFRFAYPELANAMLKPANRIRRSTLDDARRHGLKVPSEIPDIDLEDQKQMMRTLITNFARQNRPDLFMRLGLSVD